MKRRALLLAAAAVTAAMLLIAAPEALAAAGGGSSGFGGGGGGGGRGRGVGLYILIQILIRIAIFGHGLGALLLIGLIVLAVLFFKLSPRMQAAFSTQQAQGPAARRRTAQRERRVELAAAEAAEDDPAFAPDQVRSAATHLFKEIEAAWDAADLTHLRRLVAPDLLAEWERRLNDFAHRGWRNRVEVLDEPAVEYVGLHHQGDHAKDRVVVRIQARLRDVVQDAYGNLITRRGRMSPVVTIREFWTLRRNPSGHWMLASVEQGAEGQHALEEQIVATPWSDEQAMRDEALVEGAVAEAVPAGTTVAEVAKLDFDGDARAAALDLSLADGRFAPDVLEVAARRAVAAWAEAVDGGKEQLRDIADPTAAAELLHPGDPSGRTRLVVRGPQVKQIHITGLDPAATPPTMTVEVEVEGCRYLEDRNTAAVLSGSRDRRTSFSEHWTFALDGDPSQPWRISAVGAAPQSA
jgi:predicted lipid-binding transport protein (Tim44 family)